MTVATSPETFVAGETVTYYRGENRMPVQVVSVDGDEVIANIYGDLVIFKPRASDGMHVKEGSPDYEVLPEMIYHPKPVLSKNENSVKEWFSRFLLG